MVEKIRASKISIEKPTEDAEVWIHITIQKVIYDDDKKTVINRIPRFDYISKPLSVMISENYNFVDPDGNVQTIDGLNVMNIIFGVTLTWLTEKYGGTIDEDGNLWL